MTMPQGQVTGRPPGLEYLTTINQLSVHQKVEILEVLVRFEVLAIYQISTDYGNDNKFYIRNNQGEDVYYGIEETTCCCRCCAGPSRTFTMKIFDIYGNEVIHLYRPVACQCCCSPCCLQAMEVSAPPGTVVGSIQQEWSIFYPTFAVKNVNDETVLTIKGPCCPGSMGEDADCTITTADGEDVGEITKHWSGCVREIFPDADNFGITFPSELDVNMKATLLGALFLIDVLFYEKPAQERRFRRRRRL